MELSDANHDLLDSLVGKEVVAWHEGKGGIHFDLDDGRVVIFSGAFIIAIYGAETEQLH